MALPETGNIRRLLVVLPSWVGDAVMATPTLRALRALMPEARITCLLRSYVRPIVDAAPWHDGLIVTRRPGRLARDGRELVGRLRRRRFDAAVILPNSFRSALVVRLAGVPRRVGYDSDGRAALLTDRLLPLRRLGRPVPVPAVSYYLGLARYLGAAGDDHRIELFTRATDEAFAESLTAAVAPARPRVLLCPGAATKGAAKLWPTDRFAALADHLASKHGAAVLLAGAPAERPLLDDVARQTRTPTINLLDHDVDLRKLKAVCRRIDLVVANDTGARHVAAAMGTPVISLFGPTDPEWTRLDLPHETVICSAAADRAMSGIDTTAVIDAAERVLASAAHEVAS